MIGGNKPDNDSNQMAFKRPQEHQQGNFSGDHKLAQNPWPQLEAAASKVRDIAHIQKIAPRGDSGFILSKHPLIADSSIGIGMNQFGAPKERPFTEFHPPHQPIQAPRQEDFRLSAFKGTCYCGNRGRDAEGFNKCNSQNCSNIAHRCCMPWRIQDLGEFECSACIILANDPLNEVQTVLLEPSLIQSGFEYKFKLGLDSLQRIKESSNLDVEVRCIKMDGEHFFEQTWPDKCEIRINDVLVKDVKLLAQNSSLKKRRDEKLSRFVQQLKGGTNKISVSFQNVMDGKNSKLHRDAPYTFTVVIVEKLAVNALADKIINKCTLSKAECKKNISSKFGDYKDLKISEVKANLVCLVSFTHLVHPARGKNCSHLGCFSLPIFLKTMQSNALRNWLCPLCRKPCYKLVVDSYIEELVKEAKTQDISKNQVLFSKDGKYRFVTDKDQPGSNSPSRSHSNSYKPVVKDNHEPEILSLDEDDMRIEPLGKNSKIAPFNPLEPKPQGSGEYAMMLGKRDEESSDFLSDPEFMANLYSYVQSKADRKLDLSTYEGFMRKPSSFSGFEERLRRRLGSDYFARKCFEMLYRMIQEKLKEKKRQPPSHETIYQQLLTKIRGDAAGTTGAPGPTIGGGEGLDVLQQLMKKYRIDYTPLPYSRTSDRDETHSLTLTL